jgi:hypothetical protein
MAGILDQIMKMKKKNVSDEEIVNQLSMQGVSPREINDALRQAQIKNAVGGNGNYNGDEFQESIMPEGEVPAPVYQNENPDYRQTYRRVEEQEYVPQQEEYPQPEEQQYMAQEQQEYAPAETGYAPAVDTDKIIEIADQIFSDKIKTFQKVLDATSEAAIMLQTKIENVSDRLKKMENIIDKLQIAILEKVGSYGQDLGSIRKEMSMMQDSFSKMISPRETKKTVVEETIERVPKRKK